MSNFLNSMFNSYIFGIIDLSLIKDIRGIKLPDLFPEKKGLIIGLPCYYNVKKAIKQIIGIYVRKANITSQNLNC